MILIFYLRHGKHRPVSLLYLVSLPYLCLMKPDGDKRFLAAEKKILLLISLTDQFCKWIYEYTSQY